MAKYLLITCEHRDGLSSCGRNDAIHAHHCFPRYIHYSSIRFILHEVQRVGPCVRLSPRFLLRNFCRDIRDRSAHDGCLCVIHTRSCSSRCNLRGPVSAWVCVLREMCPNGPIGRFQGLNYVSFRRWNCACTSSDRAARST